jgi:hypothetical protein
MKHTTRLAGGIAAMGVAALFTITTALPAAARQDPGRPASSACDPSLAGSQAYAECLAREARPNPAPDAATRRDGSRTAPNPVEVPRIQPVQAGGDGGAANWQLALSALAGAVAGGGVAVSARRLRHQPTGAGV